MAFACGSAVQTVAGWIASRTWRRAWRGGDSSAADVALSCWYLYSDAVISLSTVWRTDALKALWHSVGLMPAKAVLVILQGFLESLGSTVVHLIVVGI